MKKLQNVFLSSIVRFVLLQYFLICLCGALYCEAKTQITVSAVASNQERALLKAKDKFFQFIISESHERKAKLSPVIMQGSWVIPDAMADLLMDNVIKKVNKIADKEQYEATLSIDKNTYDNILQASSEIHLQEARKRLSAIVDNASLSADKRITSLMLAWDNYLCIMDSTLLSSSFADSVMEQTELLNNQVRITTPRSTFTPQNETVSVLFAAWIEGMPSFPLGNVQVNLHAKGVAEKADTTIITDARGSVEMQIRVDKEDRQYSYEIDAVPSLYSITAYPIVQADVLSLLLRDKIPIKKGTFVVRSIRKQTMGLQTNIKNTDLSMITSYFQKQGYALVTENKDTDYSLSIQFTKTESGKVSMNGYYCAGYIRVLLQTNYNIIMKEFESVPITVFSKQSAKNAEEKLIQKLLNNLQLKMK